MIAFCFILDIFVAPAGSPSQHAASIAASARPVFHDMTTTVCG